MSDRRGEKFGNAREGAMFRIEAKRSATVPLAKGEGRVDGWPKRSHYCKIDDSWSAFRFFRADANEATEIEKLEERA